MTVINCITCGKEAFFKHVETEEKKDSLGKKYKVKREEYYCRTDAPRGSVPINPTVAEVKREKEQTSLFGFAK